MGHSSLFGARDVQNRVPSLPGYPLKVSGPVLVDTLYRLGGVWSAFKRVPGPTANQSKAPQQTGPNELRLCQHP